MTDRGKEFKRGGKVVDISDLLDKKRREAALHEHLHSEMEVINNGHGPVMIPRMRKWRENADALSESIGKPVIHPNTNNCTICGNPFG